MNVPIKRVYWVTVALFVLLIAYTARWTVFEADALQRNSLNQIPLLRELREPRGPVLAADGSTIARSVRVRGGDGLYERRYPRGELFAHPVGYSFARRGNAGLEGYYDDRLVGRGEELVTVVDQLLGKERDEQTMVTALDPNAQRVATQALGGNPGAIVVIEPRSGRVPVYVSSPGYDPGRVRSERGYRSLTRDEFNAPLVDRVAQSAYPPGSTFKVVTAAAALDSGLYRPQSRINGDSPKVFSGTELSNFGGTSWGDVSFTFALTKSVNTVFARVGERLGNETLIDYMKRFGFYERPPIDLDDTVASGLRERGTLLPDDADVDLARVAIGQERLAVTPLQMATVAATVANGGVRVRPHIARSFRDRYGRAKHTVEADEVERVMSAETASQLTQMMSDVVSEGTGTAAALAGISVAGKTGTAEVSARGGGDANQAWFIGFAPVERPRYAIAVTVQETTGTGGTVAAPIAKQVFESLLRRGG